MECAAWSVCSNTILFSQSKPIRHSRKYNVVEQTFMISLSIHARTSITWSSGNPYLPAYIAIISRMVLSRFSMASCILCSKAIRRSQYSLNVLSPPILLTNKMHLWGEGKPPTDASKEFRLDGELSGMLHCLAAVSCIRYRFSTKALQ